MIPSSKGKGYPEVIVRLIVDVVSVVLSPLFMLVTELSLVKWGIVGMARAGLRYATPKRQENALKTV